MNDEAYNLFVKGISGGHDKHDAHLHVMAWADHWKNRDAGGRVNPNETEWLLHLRNIIFQSLEQRDGTFWRQFADFIEDSNSIDPRRAILAQLHAPKWNAKTRRHVHPRYTHTEILYVFDRLGIGISERQLRRFMTEGRFRFKHARQ